MGHKVETELTLQDHMSEALHHIGEGFEALDEKVKEAGHEIVGTFKQAAAVALGFQLEGAIEGVKELGHEAFEAAAGVETQEKAIRGVLAMIDEEGASLEELGVEAHELNERFAEMGEATGAAKGDIVAAFDEMAERTGLATKDVTTLTEEMANAGKAVPGGIGALSEGFSNLSSGIIRARNPIVQMISATGLLHGNAKQVAEQMKKMGPEKAMQLGIDAVEKMGAKMKGLPLTFGELVTSLKGVREEIFESLGTPVLQALTGPLNKLRGYFDEHKKAILEWAEAVGHDAGEWLEKSFQYLVDHGDEIKADLKEGAEYIRKAFEVASEVVHFMWDHREAIALAYGASKVAGMAGGGVGGLAAAEGVVLVALVADQINKLSKETGGFKSEAQMNREARVDTATTTAHAGDVAATKQITDAMVEADPAMRQMADNLMVVAQQAAAMNKATDELGQTLNGVNSKDTLGIRALNDGPEKQAEAMAGMYEAAVANQDTATENYLAHYAASNQDIFNAMNQGGDEFAEVTQQFIAKIAAFAPELAKTMSASYANEHGTGVRSADIKAPPIYNQNFTGPINIQQDFRDQDPDRIATVFRTDMARAARSKVSASTHVPQSSF